MANEGGGGEGGVGRGKGLSFQHGFITKSLQNKFDCVREVNQPGLH